MTATTLEKWMAQNGKTIVDIASALKLAPGTVRNYLAGRPVHRSTLSLLESLIAPEPKQSRPARRKELIGA